VRAKMAGTAVDLRARLLLLVLVAMMPAIAVVAYTTLSERQQAAARAQKDALNLVQFAAAEQQRLIASTRQLLHGVSKLPEVRNPSNLAACHRALADVHRLFPQYRMIALARADGEVICRSWQQGVKNNILDRAYFQRAMQTRDFGIGDYQIGRVSHLNSVNFGQAVLDAHGRVRGVAFAALDLTWLNRIVSTYDLPVGSLLQIIDGKGTVVASSSDINTPAGESIGHSELFNIILANSEQGTGEAVWPDGVARFYAYVPLHSSPSGRVYVTVGLSKRAVYADADLHLMTNVAILLLVTAAVGALMWIGGEKFFVRPVRSLAATLRSFLPNDVADSAGARSRDYDLGEVARDVARLAEHTRSVSNALERTKRECRVRADLSRAIARASNAQGLAEEICRILTDAGRFACAWIGCPLHDERRSIEALAQAEFGGGMQALKEMISKATWADDERGRGLAGTAIRTGRPYVSSHILTDPNLSAWRDEAAVREFAAGAAFPVVIDGKVEGALTVYSNETGLIAQEQELLADAAEIVALGLRRFRHRRHDHATDLGENE
jgi:cache domain-containing protein/GAF domain-containing protein